MEREREANVRGCSASEKKAQGWSFTFRPARTHTHTPLPDELPCFVTVVVLKWLCDGEKKTNTKFRRFWWMDGTTPDVCHKLAINFLFT